MDHLILFYVFRYLSMCCSRAPLSFQRPCLECTKVSRLSTMLSKHTTNQPPSKTRVFASVYCKILTLLLFLFQQRNTLFLDASNMSVVQVKGDTMCGRFLRAFKL
jgi:hypothetical protein